MNWRSDLGYDHLPIHRAHELEKPFHCKECTNRYESEHELLHHCHFQHSPGDTWECSKLHSFDCVFLKEGAQFEGTQRSSEVNSVCGYCGKSCPETDRKYHMYIHRTPGCTWRMQTFFRSEDLYQHLIRSHAAIPNPFLDKLVEIAHTKATHQIPRTAEPAKNTQSLLVTSRMDLENAILAQNALSESLDESADDYEQRLAAREATKLDLERQLAALGSGRPLDSMSGFEDFARTGVDDSVTVSSPRSMFDWNQMQMPMGFDTNMVQPDMLISPDMNFDPAVLHMMLCPDLIGAIDGRNDQTFQPDMASPMLIPNAQDALRPASPPSSHILDFTPGQDSGWELDNNSASAGFGRSPPVRSGSNLLGGGVKSLPHTQELGHLQNVDDGPRVSVFDPTCNKVFQRSSSLKLHSHTHLGERKFKCPHVECGKAFSVRSILSVHEREHHNGAPNMMGPATYVTCSAPSISNLPVSAMADTIKDLVVSQCHAENQATAQNQGNHTPGPRSYYLTGKLVTLLHILTRWCRPMPRRNHSRLEWHCYCGQQFWGDFKSDEPEKLHRLISQFQQHGFAVNTAMKTTAASGTSSTTGATSSSQNTTTSASTSSPSASSSTSRASKNGASTTPPGTASPAVPAPASLQSIGKPVYLELCINRSSRITQLGEIIIVDGRGKQLINTDLELFGKCGSVTILTRTHN